MVSSIPHMLKPSQRQARRTEIVSKTDVERRIEQRGKIWWNDGELQPGATIYPFLLRRHAHGLRAPKAVSKWKLKKLRRRGSRSGRLDPPPGQWVAMVRS